MRETDRDFKRRKDGVVGLRQFFDWWLPQEPIRTLVQHTAYTMHLIFNVWPLSINYSHPRDFLRISMPDTCKQTDIELLSCVAHIPDPETQILAPSTSRIDAHVGFSGPCLMLSYRNKMWSRFCRLDSSTTHVRLDVIVIEDILIISYQAHSAGTALSTSAT